MAATLLRLDDGDVAIKLYQHVVDVRRRTLGADHPATQAAEAALRKAQAT